MRIAIWHNLPIGGGHRALTYQVRGLLRRGHQVGVWYPPSAEAIEVEPGKNFRLHPSALNWPDIETVSGRHLGLLDYRNLLRQIDAMNEHCQSCAQEIDEQGFDVLLAHPCKFFRTSSIAKYCALPAALWLQEPMRSLYEASPTLPLTARIRLGPGLLRPRILSLFICDHLRLQTLSAQARSERDNVLEFEIVFVNSLFSRESLLKTYGIESKVNYLGVDSDLFRPQDISRQKMVIGLGYIYERKGVDRAIRAVATIDRELRPTLIWVGNGAVEHYVKEMRELADELGVQFEPRLNVSDSELVGLLNEAAALIYTPRLEPFGLAPLEANACQTPVVGIAEGGVRESIKNGINGILLNSDEPQGLGDALALFLESDELRHKMGRMARRHVVDEWNWDRSVDQLEECLQGLAAE